MEKETGIVATEVLHVMKKSLKRIYILLILFIVLFSLSIIDSIYQRCRLIKVIREYETMITEDVCKQTINSEKG